MAILRNIHVLPAVDIDIQFAGDFIHRAGIQRRLLAEVLFHLVLADVVTINSQVGHIAAEPVGDGRSLRVLDPSADRNDRIVRQVEFAVRCGHFRFAHEDAQPAGFFTSGPAAFIGEGQELPFAFLRAGEIAPAELERLAVRARQCRDNRVLRRARVGLDPELGGKIAIILQRPLRPLVPQQRTVAVEPEGRHRPRLHRLDRAADRREGAPRPGNVIVGMHPGGVVVENQSAGVVPARERPVSVHGGPAARGQIDVAVARHDDAEQVIQRPVAFIQLIASVTLAHVVEAHGHILAQVRPAIATDPEVVVDMVAVHVQLEFSEPGYRPREPLHVVAELMEGHVVRIPVRIAAPRALLETAIGHRIDPPVRIRHIQPVAHLTPATVDRRIGHFALLVQRPGNPLGHIVAKHLQRRHRHRTRPVPHPLLALAHPRSQRTSIVVVVGRLAIHRVHFRREIVLDIERPHRPANHAIDHATGFVMPAFPLPIFGLGLENNEIDLPVHRVSRLHHFHRREGLPRFIPAHFLAIGLFFRHRLGQFFFAVFQIDSRQERRFDFRLGVPHQGVITIDGRAIGRERCLTHSIEALEPPRVAPGEHLAGRVQLLDPPVLRHAEREVFHIQCGRRRLVTFRRSVRDRLLVDPEEHPIGNRLLEGGLPRQRDFALLRARPVGRRWRIRIRHPQACPHLEEIHGVVVQLDLADQSVEDKRRARRVHEPARAAVAADKEEIARIVGDDSARRLAVLASRNEHSRAIRKPVTVHGAIGSRELRPRHGSVPEVVRFAWEQPFQFMRKRAGLDRLEAVREVPVHVPPLVPVVPVILPVHRQHAAVLTVPREQLAVQRRRGGGDVRDRQPLDLRVIFLLAEKRPIDVGREHAVVPAGVGIRHQLPILTSARAALRRPTHPRNIRLCQSQTGLLPALNRTPSEHRRVRLDPYRGLHFPRLRIHLR